MDVLDQTVVVGVNDSASLATVDAAAAEALLRGAGLAMVWAHPAAGGAGGGAGLTAMLRRTIATWPDVAVTARNVSGDPAGVLIDASRTASLVVLGRRRPDREVRAGSVANQVAAHAWCPTMVVPANAPVRPDRPVLLGLGLSPDDEPAMAFAFEEAALRHAPLLAAHVWSGIPASALATVSPFAYDLNEAQSTADRMLAEALAGWADKYPDVRVERMPLYDVNAAHALADASRLAGLVVVATRRDGHRSSQLLGAVARGLIARAARPVVAVRPASWRWTTATPWVRPGIGGE